MAQPATRNLGRLSEIAQVAVRHGFGYWFDTHRLTDLFPRRGPRVELDGQPSQRGAHLREMLDELGPTFVKFGQLLSTRPDVLPPDIIAELRGLQDDVRPVPVRRRREGHRGGSRPDRRPALHRVRRAPVAAASIGQVHRATLPNGRRVAVKVQRPGAPRQIEADLALLYQAARIAKERVRALDFIDARQLVDEFARQIRQELDYRLEARNADAFHRNFAGHPHVRVPRVYWSYTRSRVLTLEWLDGIQVADIHPDEWSLEERRDLAYLMTETWMTMIFRHGFFHGDPHPANILVLGRADQIGLVDFGAVGKLTDDDLTKLTRMFIDAASENVDALPKRLADLGVRYPKEREEEFLAELREIYYRYYGASLAEIDPMQIIREAFQLIYSMNLRLPARFLLLDRAIATLGSVGVDLYPDFNVFEVARPYARSLLLDRFGPRRMATRARKETLRLGEMALELPYQLHDILEEVRDGQIEVGFVHKGLDDLLNRLDVVFNRLVIAMIVAGGLIGSSLIGIFAKAGPQLLGDQHHLGARLHVLRPARHVVALGRGPERTLVDRSSLFRAKGHLVPRERRRYVRLHVHGTSARRAGAVPRATPAQRRLRRRRRCGAAGHRAPCRQRGGGGVPGAAGGCAGDRPRPPGVGCRRPRACVGTWLRRLPRAAVCVRGVARAHSGRVATHDSGGATRFDTPAPITADLATRSVTVDEVAVSLAGKEYELLLKLMTDPTRVFTKEQLLREVWGFRSLGRTRTLDSHASRLRRKLAAAGAGSGRRQRVGGGLQAVVGSAE